MTFINYAAEGIEAIKNWELMTKPATTKLSYDESEEFWPFHETFLTHIDNMGWNNILIFQVDGVNKDLSTQFGEVPSATIQQDKQDHDTVYTAAVNTGVIGAALKAKRTKGKAMYTYLLNSIDKRYKRHFTNNFDSHQHWGPLAWKAITDHSVKNDNQTIRRALCRTHVMTLADYNFNVDKLITDIQENNRVLTSSGESDRSIAANLFRILKEAPNKEFVTWVLSKQTIWDEGLPFDLENFMKNAKSKYNSLMKDNLWDAKVQTAEDIKKETHIAALTSKLENLEVLLANQSKAFNTFRDNNSNRGNSQPQKSWRNTPPETGKPETIQRNGKTYYWCAKHGFWSPSHGTANCNKGKKDSNSVQPVQSGVSINFADQSIQIPNNYGIMLASHDNFSDPNIKHENTNLNYQGRSKNL